MNLTEIVCTWFTLTLEVLIFSAIFFPHTLQQTVVLDFFQIYFKSFKHCLFKLNKLRPYAV